MATWKPRLTWLRTKGLAKAAKKSGRTAAEGLVAVAVEGGKGVAVEVNSETDFVAKNAEFQEMVGGIAKAALGVSNYRGIGWPPIWTARPWPRSVTDKVATIGENMSVRRMSAKVTGDGGVHVCPQRRNRRHGQDRRAGVVHRQGRRLSPARSPCTSPPHDPRPQALNESELDPAVVEKEKPIQIDIARESGKPEQVIEKMIEGRMKQVPGGHHACEPGLCGEPGPDRGQGRRRRPA